MALKHKKTDCITTVAPDGYVRLYHGTRSQMIDSIIEFGVDEGRAKACGGGDGFCAAKDYEMAKWYSARPGEPGLRAVLAFDLAIESVERLLHEEKLVDHYFHGFLEFFPPSYPVLNAEMTNIEITITA